MQRRTAPRPWAFGTRNAAVMQPQGASMLVPSLVEIATARTARPLPHLASPMSAPGATASCRCAPSLRSTYATLRRPHLASSTPGRVATASCRCEASARLTRAPLPRPASMTPAPEANASYRCVLSVRSTLSRSVPSAHSTCAIARRPPTMRQSTSLLQVGFARLSCRQPAAVHLPAFSRQAAQRLKSVSESSLDDLSALEWPPAGSQPGDLE